MQRSLKYFFVLQGALILLGSCGSQPTTDKGENAPAPSTSNQSTIANPPGWSNKMQELSSTLSALIPVLSDVKQYADEKNDNMIKSATSKLRNLSHQIKSMSGGTAKPSSDPALTPIASMLEEDLARASASLETGNKDYARLVLRESISYCIQCHTQSANGPSFSKHKLSFDTSQLSPLARGDFYAATRQFDAALESYTSAAKNSDYAKKDIFGWEKAVRSGLAIAVRFKENPEAAKELALAVSKNQQAPDSLKAAAKNWLDDVKSWMGEKADSKSRLAKAEKLLQTAKTRDQGGQRSANEILYLRASSDLHQWLSNDSSAPASEKAKALYLAGQAADATRELNFWVLHERYFEQCINTAPRTTIAQTCFGKLKESIELGYTGSAGTQLPADESARIAHLKEVAYGAAHP